MSLIYNERWPVYGTNKITNIMPDVKQHVSSVLLC